ncbi:hypothetical protein, partial [Thiolapillus sp.]|uniref:hypothetical protein n=1 Tax=Thiolapillus sp. TaxID=2017437 RepID=UPI003AF60436
WITMALCFLQVLREPVVQYLAGSEQRIAPFWNIITWYPTSNGQYEQNSNFISPENIRWNNVAYSKL